MRRLAFAGLAAAALLAGCAGGTAVGADTTKPAPPVTEQASPSAVPQPPCTFEVGLKRTQYRVQEPIEAIFTLTNTGSAPLMVNRRLLLNGQLAPPQDREIYLEVTGPSGNPVKLEGPKEVGLPRTEEFIELAPGESVASERPKNLAAYEGFREPGTYTIVGVYENVFGAELGLDAFKGPVRSQPVTVTIKP